MRLPLQIQTTDTGEIYGVTALLDSGATGLFIDRDYVKTNQLTTRKLRLPIPVYNVDGTRNEAGSITEVVDLILRHAGHSERTQFAVTGLGRQKLLLGYTWLREHNPEVDWKTKEVRMTRCPPQCHMCQQELRQNERRIAQ